MESDLDNCVLKKPTCVMSCLSHLLSWLDLTPRKCLRKEANKVKPYLGFGKRKATATLWDTKLRKISDLIVQVAFETEAAVSQSWLPCARIEGMAAGQGKLKDAEQKWFFYWLPAIALTYLISGCHCAFWLDAV